MDSIAKLTRILLAIASFAVAAGRPALASSIVYNEGTALQTFPPAVDLAAAGTTPVNGTQTGFASEWEVSGLGSGTFTITASSDGVSGDYLRVYNSSCFAGACFIESNTFDNASSANFMSEPIPATGDLFFLVQFNSSEQNDFSVTVTTSGGGTSSAPEPSTLPLVGLGVTGALAILRICGAAPCAATDPSGLPTEP
jgi:hypothetical protein